MNHSHRFALLALLATLCCLPVAGARLMINPPGGAGAGGSVNLPYAVNDAQGNSWRIYQGGMLQQQGNMPMYSQGAVLSINGSQASSRNNRARLDPKTGELIFDGMTLGNLAVTRRIFINKDESYVRYIDLFKNTQKQDVSINLQIQTNLNYGVEAAQMVPDLKKPGQNLAWVAQTGAGRAVVELFAGRGSKTAVNITWPQGNSYVQGGIQLTVPAGREVALLHFHATAMSQDAGVQWINSLKENKLLAAIPREFRRLIVNFVGGQSFVGDYEILRGDALDVIELRGGDIVKGTLKDQAFKLSTFYGNIEVPADRIIGMINIGEFRPRQLLVTAEGEVFGGTVGQKTLAIELSSGQITQIPVNQITRLGYRKRAGEPDEWTFDKPFVLMRSGDRVGVQMPAEPVDVLTRYGRLKIDSKSIAYIQLQSEEHGVHEIHLTDGSKFAGLISIEQFQMKLASTSGKDQPVTFPTASVMRLQFNTPSDEAADPQPQLDLVNEDTLTATLTGQLRLDTAFDTLTLNASEVKRLTHARGGGLDVQITLWDQTAVSGQLQTQDLECRLNCGLVMRVPVALIDQYYQPLPQPSAQMLEKIKALVAQLNAEDWKLRDGAEQQLTALGSGIVGPLRQMRPDQPPEAQQRIDNILKKMEKDSPPASPTVAPVPPAPMMDQ